MEIRNIFYYSIIRNLKNFTNKAALGIVTPWGGTVVPFYEVGWERSYTRLRTLVLSRCYPLCGEPGNP